MLFLSNTLQLFVTMNSSQKKIKKEPYKICPNCHNFAPFETNETFCIVCGEKLLDKCPNCSEPIIYPTSTYCPVCGTMLLKQKRNK